MEHEQLRSRLRRGEVVAMPAAQWQALEPSYQLKVAHDTQVAGMLQVMQGPAGLVAVEAPTPMERTIRAFADEQAAEAFVTERLNRYERMWEG